MQDKLIGVIRRSFCENYVSVGVYPALVPVKEIIAQTDGVFNGISLSGTVVGTVVLTGRGAGQDPTAGSVISDIVDVVKGMQGDASPPKLLHVTPDECKPAPSKEISGCFYLRLSVDDRPGQLAKVAENLAEHDVSLATVSQTPDDHAQSASIILTTHLTNEHSIAKAIESLEQLDGCRSLRFYFECLTPIVLNKNEYCCTEIWRYLSCRCRPHQTGRKESKATFKEGHQVVVVVSARAGVTNQLIERASAILKNPTEREMDVLMTCGEQETIALMTLALHALNVPAISRTGWQAEILTEGIHTKARIREVRLGDIRKQLRAGNVVVVAGFQGVSDQGM